MEGLLLIITILYALGVVTLLLQNIRMAKKVKSDRVAVETAQTSYYDRVTGLASMTMFRDTLAYSTSKPKEKEPLSVMALSLEVNDSDLDEVQKGILLKNIVKRIKDCLRATDFVAKADDETFYILLTRVTTPQSIELVAKRLLGVFKNTFHVTNVTIIATPYLGISTYPNEDSDLDTLISNSHTAMRQIKSEGKTGLHFYKSEGCKEDGQQEVLVSDLKEALKNHEFVLHYQPQYSLEGKKVIGVEALIRWNHPQRGLLAPYHFITIAENSPFIEELTNWVMREACRQHKEWGVANLTMSVNISASQFKAKNFIKQIEAAVRLTAIKPENLNLEITETVSIDDREYTMEVLKKLKAKGFKVSIDDFGVGHSALSYIKDFPVDYIKLDRSFIRDLEVNSTGEVILRSIIQMARDLNLKVVAEGVETKEHLDFLLHENCHEIQGYYIAKPLPPDELYHFITSEVFKIA